MAENRRRSSARHDQPANHRNLRLFLANRGGIFAAFGRFLSARIDMLPYGLCKELAAIPDYSPATDVERLRTVFNQELGCPPELAFARFDYQAFESRLFWQAHAASLAGADVVVRIIHPEIEASRTDVDLLACLEEPLAACGARMPVLRRSLADFGRALETSLSFDGDVRAAALLTQDADSFDLLGAPRVRAHLCTNRVAVYEANRRVETSRPAPDLARAICLVWLHQALEGTTYPVEPSLENIEFSPEGRIVFTSGPFAVLPAASKARILEYLSAVAAENTDEACGRLAEEIGEDPEGPAYVELQRRLRQMVPFRDSASNEVPGSRANLWQQQWFASTVLTHWRIANERGRMSEAQLIPFYRGLVAIAGSAQRLAPGTDWMAEALRDLRVLAAFNRAKTMIRPSQVASLVEKYGAGMLTMPTQMDRMLDIAAGGTIPVASGKPAGSHGADGASRYVAVAGLLVALVGVAILAHKSTSASQFAGPGKILAALFALFALVILRIGARLS